MKKSKVIYFWGNDNDNGELSQFYPSRFVEVLPQDMTWKELWSICPLELEKRLKEETNLGNKYEFLCAEQYMMFCKAMLFDDEESAKKVMEATSPPKMKAIGRRVYNFDEDIWKQYRFNIVKRGNYLKFSQNEQIQKTLHILSEKDVKFAESSPYDRIWGIGISTIDAKSGESWKGLNLLGQALDEVRTLLREKLK